MKRLESKDTMKKEKLKEYRNENKEKLKDWQIKKMK